MRVTALEEYGLRCMLLLAKNGNETLTLSDFSRREGLSIPYAGKLLMILKKSGLVKAARGRSGGYALARASDEIFLKEIFDALGEPIFSPTHCRKFSGDDLICVHTEDCSVRDIWRGFGGLLSNMLEHVTLADIASGNEAIMENLKAVSSTKESARET